MGVTLLDVEVNANEPVLGLPPDYKQTKVGVIPADWREATLREITTKIGSGITPTGGSTRYREHGRPFVRSQNIGWGRLLLDDLVFIDEDTHNEFPATELKPLDVLLNITGASIGRVALADERLNGGNVNQHVCIVRPDDRQLSPQLISLLLLSSIGQRQIDSFLRSAQSGFHCPQPRRSKKPLPRR
jgi:type I restriction enzyme, S subunit